MARICDLVEAAGRLLAIPGDERHGGPFVEQLRHRGHRAHGEIEVSGNLRHRVKGLRGMGLCVRHEAALTTRRAPRRALTFAETVPGARGLARIKRCGIVRARLRAPAPFDDLHARSYRQPRLRGPILERCPCTGLSGARSRRAARVLDNHRRPRAAAVVRRRCARCHRRAPSPRLVGPLAVACSRHRAARCHCLHDGDPCGRTCRLLFVGARPGFPSGCPDHAPGCTSLP